jgi:hypothetical protein
LKTENSRRVANSRPVCLGVKTRRTQFGKRGAIFQFLKVNKMKETFKRYVDQITQNVIALLNILKT